MDELIAKKSLGQHWLHDSGTLEAMCDAAGVSKGDVVLEIGPGTGTLTDHLLARGAEIVALEFDQKLADMLTQKYNLPGAKISVQQGDIRTYDFSTLPQDYKIVANIPYYLTSHLIRSISETPNPPTIAALLIQKEVAERVVASPGDMSLLSVSAQFYWDVSLGLVAPAALFTPKPKVDSQILILTRRDTQLFADADQKVFFQLVKAGFSARRKTLLNSLSGGLRLAKPEVTQLLERAGISETLRPQALSLEQWYSLYNAWQEVY